MSEKWSFNIFLMKLLVGGLQILLIHISVIVETTVEKGVFAPFFHFSCITKKHNERPKKKQKGPENDEWGKKPA